jgi:alcohol dehydrogenase class IV
MGLHHALCHVLGGSFGLPHAETHAIVLPHAVAYNAAAAPHAMTVVARALGEAGFGSAAPDVPTALHALATDVLRAAGAPTSLGALDLGAADLARAAELTAARAYPNPRPVHADALGALLARAHAGAPPEVVASA